MMYAAVQLCPSGGIVRHEDTQEAASVLIGDFESMDDAVQQACSDLKCKLVRNGVLSKGYGLSGYMVVTTQELEAV
ncbi:TPA: hypothetical protein N2750_003930 [Vibrio parahaemolyticus]|uniref:hypothetical protein n=1 Tax=Vibrio parahaemolyticus TaxID=670 RepID=UPI000934E435|nr:hypothetical protein [Vibrio parahaemolyticus]MQF42698.1 hypothetical protein [Vibrio parahaemolyticus]TOZ99737.1 hypothetical protein DXJ96_22660 [Vibrio parahaemolyticus]HCE1985933.1 hypothetical protein [Vibrio parahaemolyticus]HCG9135946.1 hypothetical protein [Vibrio parahaemolyticus]HCH0342438.1 hypothetical protein [Vibrio parahaemolyticus]